MRRHELTDAHFQLLEPYLPQSGPTVAIPGPNIAAFSMACSGNWALARNGVISLSDMGRGAQSTTAIAAGVRKDGLPVC